MAAASITKHTNAVAIVVSESSIVRIFDNGEIVGEIILELWMLQHYSIHLTDGEYSTRSHEQMTIVSKNQ